MNLQKFDHPSDKRLITGTSGTGKTHLLEKLVRREKARLKFIYDHQGEFSRRFGVEPVFDCEGLIQKTTCGGYVVFDPVVQFKGRSGEGFAFFCDYVFAVSESIKGRKILVCDELQKLTSNKKEPEEILAVLDTGRRFQLDAIFVSQAPNRIHNGIRNQLTHVYTFRQSDANAIGYLEENGFPAELVRTLPNYKFLFKNLNTGEQNFEASKNAPIQAPIPAEKPEPTQPAEPEPSRDANPLPAQ